MHIHICIYLEGGREEGEGEDGESTHARYPKETALMIDLRLLILVCLLDTGSTRYLSLCSNDRQSAWCEVLSGDQRP